MCSSERSQVRRGAVTLVEVLVAFAILGMAILPLLRSGSSVHKRSYFNEYHTIATVRARTLIGLVSQIDFDVLDRYAVSKGPAGTAVGVPLETILETGWSVQLFADPVAGAHHVGKLKLFEHDVTWTHEEDDLARVEVRVRWRLPGEESKPAHEVKIARLFSRPEGSISRLVPLR